MMYDVIIEDLKKFIEVFWKRDDIDIRNFDCYKGFTYALMQMYKRPDYQEQKNELMSYMEHRFDDWKLYFVKLMIELMKEDSSISEYDRSRLPVCKFKADIPDAIYHIKKYHNAFIVAGDFATDIYRNTIKNYKNARKKVVLNNLKCCHVHDYEVLYERFEQHDDILDILYKYFTCNYVPDTKHCPFEVKRFYELKKCKYNWQLCVCWLEYAENKKAFIEKYNQLRYNQRDKNKNKLIKELKLVHKLIMSNPFDDIKVIKAWDRDTACELGCSSEEYLSSDWESEVEFSENFNEFLSDCYVDKCVGYRFVIIDGEDTFTFVVGLNE